MRFQWLRPPPTLYSELETTVDGLVCNLDDEDCEACQ